MQRLNLASDDALCKHTIQQNATAAGVPPWTTLGELTPDPLAGFKGPLCGGEGKRG